MKITAKFLVSRSLGTRNAPETFRDFRERDPSSGCLTLPGDNVFLWARQQWWLLCVAYLEAIQSLFCFPNRATPRCVWSVRYYMTSYVGLVFRIAWQEQAYFITFVTVSKKHWTVQIAWKRFVNVLGPVLLCPLLNEKRDVFKMSKILYSVKCLRSLICIFDYVYLLILISLFFLFLIVVFTLFELKANSACSPPK